MDDWAAILRAVAGSYAPVALATIKREFPSPISHTMRSPGDSVPAPGPHARLCPRDGPGTSR
ncbi:MAG: hypothetical protein ACRDNZ_23670 [Streptosporangiaceae bacterium]